MSWRRLETIELPDCEYESLLEFFHVMGVLYLAKKYMVPPLAEKCTEYLQSNLNALNVFSILPTAERYEEKELVDRYWKVIGEQKKVAVKADGLA